MLNKLAYLMNACVYISLILVMGWIIIFLSGKILVRLLYWKNWLKNEYLKYKLMVERDNKEILDIENKIKESEKKGMVKT